MTAMLVLLISNGLVTLVRAADPDWMVTVVKKLGVEREINGTGYIVRIGDKYFIRTAAHVTLGSEEDVAIYDNQGKKIDIVANGMITNNATDDQMFEIKKERTYLGVYSPTLQQFVVEGSLQDKVSSLKNKVYVSQNPAPIFYISPERIKRAKQDDLKKSQKNDGIPGLKSIPGLSGLSARPGLNDMDPARFLLANSGESAFSRMRVIPGESGSPLIGYFLGKNDPNTRRLTVDAKAAVIKDLLGVNLNVRSNKDEPYIKVIYGHALSFHRILRLSNFSSYASTEVLVRAYLSGQRGDISGVSWLYQDGTPYRRMQADGHVIDETHFPTTKKAGDGTGGNGGDGTGGNGGDGTGGNGGDTDPNVTPRMGILYDSKPVYAFKVRGKAVKPYSLYGSWENFRYLQKNKDLKFEIVTFEQPVGHIIETKKGTEGPDDYIPLNTICYINVDSLRRGTLDARIEKVGRIVRDISQDGFRNFHPSETLVTQDGRSVAIDYRGLWSTDFTNVEDYRASYFGRDAERALKYTPYLTIGHPNGNPLNYACALVFEESMKKL